MENIKRIQIDVTEGAKWIPTQDNVKHINVDLTPKKERRDGRCEDPDEDMEAEPEAKVPRKRVVTNMSEWTFTETELSPDNQMEYIQQIYNDAITTQNEKKCKLVLQQLKAKLYGYRNQDTIKKIYSEEQFITMKRTLQLLIESNCSCFYCNTNTKVLYEYVREPTQWSLERIDNSIGHNNDNVAIACLNCNLRRRTMNQERYVFTKQLVLLKKE